MIAIAIVALVALAFTLTMGWHPYPLFGRVYRSGPHPGLYWLAVIIEVALVVWGVALYFIN